MASELAHYSSAPSTAVSPGRATVPCAGARVHVCVAGGCWPVSARGRLGCVSVIWFHLSIMMQGTQTNPLPYPQSKPACVACRCLWECLVSLVCIFWLFGVRSTTIASTPKVAGQFVSVRFIWLAGSTSTIRCTTAFAQRTARCHFPYSPPGFFAWWGVQASWAN